MPSNCWTHRAITLVEAELAGAAIGAAGGATGWFAAVARETNVSAFATGMPDAGPPAAAPIAVLPLADGNDATPGVPCVVLCMGARCSAALLAFTDDALAFAAADPPDVNSARTSSRGASLAALTSRNKPISRCS